MTLKQLPSSQFAAMDFQLDRRSPKTPPCEFACGHVNDPIWLEPVGDVVMARDGHEAARQVAAADAFRDRGRADFGDIAIDDAGEFVESDEGSRVESQESRAGRSLWHLDSPLLTLDSVANARARSHRNRSPLLST